ncbi:protein kinase [Nonomuraea antimicrobica]
MDVYALGVLLHTMLTGRTPYPETTWEEIEAARRTEPPPRVPGVPYALAALCRRCLAHRPEDRPTAAQIVSALTAALDTATLGRNVRRGITVAGSAVLAVSALLWFQQTAPPQQPERTAKPSPSPTATARLLESSPAASATAGRTVEQTVEQAAAGFRTVLEARTPCGATDDDVVLDLKQVLEAAVSPRRGPPESRTDGLRRKLSDRLREGRLAPACLSELQARLDVIEAAIRRD